MTLFLASVRDAAEAEMAIGAGADIVDLKDPGRGALGALAPKTIAACVRAVARRVPVSATIGDLPLEGDAVRAAVLTTAARGVDYVKLGLFPGGDGERCFNLLADACGPDPPHRGFVRRCLAGVRRDRNCGTDRSRRRHARYGGQRRGLAA